jgi:2-methylcitrate dehydratase PrpD
MGIAAAGAGISRQALADQVNAKGTLAGMAARNAADAALLWAAGVAGPNRFLDGDYGLCALQAGGKHGSGQMTIEPGHFRIEKVSTKPYPSCRSSHAVVDAVMCLRARSEEIAHRVMAVSVTAPPGVVERCGKPFVAGDNPRLAAQFSIPYAAAVALRDGRPTLADFRPERVAENAIRLAPLMNAVRVTRSAERDDVLTPVHVVFEGDTGTIAEEHVRVLRGDPCLPSSHAEQRAKLQDAASGFLSSSEIEHTEEIARGVRRAGPDRLIRWLEELAARRAPHP